MTRRKYATALGSALGALLLTACGQSASPATATAPLPATTSRVDGATSKPLRPCAANQLVVVKMTSDGTAGTIYFEVQLAAKGTARCTLDGYPAVSLYRKHDRVEEILPEKPKREQVTGTAPLGTAPVKLVVGPGKSGTVAFSVGIVQVQTDSAPCDQAQGLKYATPGSEVSSGEIPFTAGTTACRPSFSVTAFQRPTASS
jgi:hypothetical protein